MRKVFHLTQEGKDCLIENNPKLKPLFEDQGAVTVLLERDFFASLVSAIVSQQLSVKVAAIIFERLQTFFNHALAPEKLMQASFDDLWSLGLSSRKIEYIKALADHVYHHQTTFNALDEKNNDDVIAFLTQIKGIGKWTAEMFLIFSLGREDVFSVGDLGLRNAVTNLYKQDMTHKEIENLSRQWSPHRTLVSLLLWQTVD